MNKVTLALAIAFGLTATSALAENVATPSNMDGWTKTNKRVDADANITGTYKPSGETGSVQFTSNNSPTGQDKVDYSHSLNGTLGDLVRNGGAQLSYQWLVDSASTTAEHLAPAFRLYYQDGAQTGYLIYEQAYNAYPTTLPGGVPNDTFVTTNMLDGKWWMRAFGPSRTIEEYSFGLADWAAGRTSGTSHMLSNATQILGVEFGIGSGWNGAFSGAVDHVLVDFGRAGTSGVSTNFELAAAGGAVPEPATWAMMIGGFGLVGGAMRRRSTRVSFA